MRVASVRPEKQPDVASVAPAGIAARPSPWLESRVRRLMDIVIAGAALVILSPVLLLITAAIRLTSEGPGIFKGPAIGKGCRQFTYFKLRSMRDNLRDDAHQQWLERFVKNDEPFALSEGEGGQVQPVYKRIDDPRITPLGRILRKLSLDEIPQLWNVVRGEMSLVGPRPPIPAEFQHYSEREKARLACRPGLTGLYQVTARSQVPFARMLEIDLEYIQSASLWLDLKIIVRTPWVMLRGRGTG